MFRVRRWRERLAALPPWPQRLIAFLSGALSVLALPPFYGVPVLLVTVPPLLWLIEDCRSGRGAFWIGWWHGFGFFLAGLYWISIALFTDIARWWFVLPFALAGLPAVLALYHALAFALCRWTIGRGLFAPAAFALCFALAEWLRGLLFTGFPWNLIGYGWVGWPAVLQAASVIGINGLGLLTMLVAALPAVLGAPQQRRRDIAAMGCGFALFVAIGFAGSWRLGQPMPQTDTQIRIVQPNIPQTEKWDAAARAAHFGILLSLSRTDAEQTAPDIVIWPETAVTFVPAEGERARTAIARMLPPGSYLATGSFRRHAGNNGEDRFSNSLDVVDSDGVIRASFDKAHLVPFGEYMPLRSVLPLDPIAAGSTDLKAGPGLSTLAVPGVPPFSPLICYEVIFPGKVTADDAARWIVNITNDAWYGRSSGPYQHLATAAGRAVEEGLPLARSANTGVSAMIDPYGRIIADLPLQQAGVIDAQLPGALSGGTVFSAAPIPTYIFLWMVVLGAGIVISSRGPVNHTEAEKT